MHIYSGIFLKYWIDRKDEAMDRVIEKKRARVRERENENENIARENIGKMNG